MATANLAVKYRPHDYEDVVEQSKVVEILRNMCDEENPANRNFLLTGSAGCGKAQPLYSWIYTPDGGYIRMGDIKPGDKVFTHTGEVAKVKSVHPQGSLHCYRILLDDGTHIDVADNHINRVIVHKKRYGKEHACTETRDLTTTELIELFKDTRHYSLSLGATCLQYPYHPTSIHPYLLGVIIGAGVLTSEFRLHLSDRTVIQTVNDILMKQYNTSLVPVNGEPTRWKIHNSALRAQLKELSLLGKSARNKFIPRDYIENDRLTRVHLLQGLFDTNGCIQGGGIIFSTNSIQLCSTFEDLVRSLGIKCTRSMQKSKYVRTDGTNSCRYYCRLRVPGDICFCTASRFNDKYYSQPFEIRRRIVDIQDIGPAPCKCIYVDHPDHTYVSDGYIPTHNTTLARICANHLNGGDGEVIEIDAASNGDAESLREIVRQAQTYPISSKWKVFIIDECHTIGTKAGWQILLKVLEEQPARTIFFFATTNPEKIPATILSRVQQFPLSKISLEGIKSRLIHVIECENKEGRGITYDENSVNFIAKLANGGMRDALTLLDKVLSYSTEITSEHLAESLNLPNYDDYFALLQAYASKNNAQIASIINQVYNSGVNFVKWFETFHSFVVNVVKYIFLQDIEATMVPSHYLPKLQKYGTPHAAICLNLANKLVKMNSELKTTQYLQELALTYLCSIPKPKKEA